MSPTTQDRATNNPVDSLTNAMHDAGIDFIASLPDSRIAPLLTAISCDRRFTHVPLTREDEGVGVCAGAWFGGRKPCLLIQNSGLLASINDLVTLGIFYQIPLLLMVAYRGYIGELHWYHGPVGRVTEPVINALGIRYAVCDRIEDATSTLLRARVLAESCNYPVIALFTLRGLGANT